MTPLPTLPVRSEANAGTRRATPDEGRHERLCPPCPPPARPLADGCGPACEARPKVAVPWGGPRDAASGLPIVGGGCSPFRP